MDTALERDLALWKIVRGQIRSLVETKDEKSLLKIPDGLANNMAWNFGHVIRSADFLIHKQAGRPLNFPDDLNSLFAKGSSPAQWGDTTGLVDRLLRAETACRQGLMDFLTSADADRPFAEPYHTSLGFVLSNGRDALSYNLVHESLHLGQMQLYAKLV